MLELYRKAKEFENIKKQIEKELLGVKLTTDKSLQLFYELKNQSEKKAFQEQLKIIKDKAKAKERNKLKTKYVIKKKEDTEEIYERKIINCVSKTKIRKKIRFLRI